MVARVSSKKKRRKQLEKQMKKRGLKNCEASHPDVRIEKVGCLHICKKGPIVATYPEIELHKRVDLDEVRALVDEVAGR